MSTLAELKSNVSTVLGLDDSDSGDGPYLTKLANDAVRDVLIRTKCYVAAMTVPLTSGVGDYQLDSTIMAIQDIYLTSQNANFRVRRLSSTDLVNLRLFSVTTSPIQMYALSGANLLMVYPAPLQSDSLHIYYVPKPTELSDPTDDPSDDDLGGIPSEFHVGLEYFMQWKAADAFDDGSSSNGETYRRWYLGDPTAPPGAQRFGFIGEMRKNMRDRGGKHLAGILLGSRGRRIYVPNPGVDTGAQYF